LKELLEDVVAFLRKASGVVVRIRKNAKTLERGCFFCGVVCVWCYVFRFLCMYGKTPILATKAVKSECMPFIFSIWSFEDMCSGYATLGVQLNEGVMKAQGIVMFKRIP
jgi:hypothetical protein